MQSISPEKPLWRKIEVNSEPPYRRLADGSVEQHVDDPPMTAVLMQKVIDFGACPVLETRRLGTITDPSVEGRASPTSKRSPSQPSNWSA